MEEPTDAADEPIIISGGSPLKIHIQSGGHWEPDAHGHHHSNPGKTARRLSFDYVDDDRWLERNLSGAWNLTMVYGASIVTITPGNGRAGQGLNVTGAAIDPHDGTVVGTPDGNFGQITFNGSLLPEFHGKVRIAIEYK